MNDKKIKEAIQQYIETKADNMLSETEERHDLSSLDEKVYATLGAKQDKRKTTAAWSFKKISVLAASFVLIIGLSITAVWILNKVFHVRRRSICYYRVRRNYPFQC